MSENKENKVTQERINEFIENLTEDQKEVYQYLASYMYSKGAEASEEKNDRTVFTNPRECDIDSLLEVDAFSDEFDRGVKTAMYYAGLTEVLVASGLSMEIVEGIILNEFAMGKKKEVDLEAILEKEANTF